MTRHEHLKDGDMPYQESRMFEATFVHGCGRYSKVSVKGDVDCLAVQVLILEPLNIVQQFIPSQHTIEDVSRSEEAKGELVFSQNVETLFHDRNICRTV